MGSVCSSLPAKFQGLGKVKGSQIIQFFPPWALISAQSLPFQPSATLNNLCLLICCLAIRLPFMGQ